MTWEVEFNETGGYDCMTGAFHIRDGDKYIVDVDLADFGQGRCDYDDSPSTVAAKEEAHTVARLIAKAPEMAELVRRGRNIANQPEDIQIKFQMDCGQLLASIEGDK